MNQRVETTCPISPHERLMSSWPALVAPTKPEPMELQRERREPLQASDDPFALYRSPEWFDHMREVGGIASTSMFLAIRRAGHGGLAAGVPLFVTSERCCFPLVLGSCYLTRPIEMIKVASGRMLLGPDGELRSGVFDDIYNRYPGLPLKIEKCPMAHLAHAVNRVEHQTRKQLWIKVCTLGRHGFEFGRNTLDVVHLGRRNEARQVAAACGHIGQNLAN
jgi:hypothetical protein